MVTQSDAGESLSYCPRCPHYLPTSARTSTQFDTQKILYDSALQASKIKAKHGAYANNAKHSNLPQIFLSSISLVFLF